MLRLLNDPARPTRRPARSYCQLVATAAPSAPAFAPDSSVYVCGFADTLGGKGLHALARAGQRRNGYDSRHERTQQCADRFLGRSAWVGGATDGKVVLGYYEQRLRARRRAGSFPVDGGVDSTVRGVGILVLQSSELDQLDALTIMDNGSLIAGGYARVNNYDRHPHQGD
ncbi:MAG: hypothetical protein IPN38_15990 [Flavobacteriales bacterium]|nr:hypothetical protein [Flavobacteriales bacterium]